MTQQLINGVITLAYVQTWWTGKQPRHGTCPGVDADGKINSLPLPNLKTATRQDILDYFDNTWTLTEVLFSALQNEEAFFRPPTHQLRHPLIFYYCHPPALYVNKLRVARLITQPINPYFEKLFETGVDEMSWDDLSKNQMTWPSAHEIRDYRSTVYQLVKNIIETHPGFDQLPITMQSPLWAIFMGMEHERIHFETSSVLMRELPIHCVKKPSEWPNYFSLLANTSHNPTQKMDYPDNHFIDVKQKQVVIGKAKDWPSYGWDNEYGKRELMVKPFRANQFLVSNGEFHEFVVSGGYQDPQYWSNEGWKWRAFRNAKWPTFWVPVGPSGLHHYQLRLCFEVVPMQWAWPAEVNYHEAKAFAVWRSLKDKMEIPYRLITEAEHHCLRNTLTYDPIMEYDSRSMRQQKINLNLAYGSQTPVNVMKEGTAEFYDVFGNAWQWCEDHFAALPEFEVHPLYDDFSSPCFDGKHHMIMGGSFISTGDEASCFARFHFRPHFFQHAGFRLVQPMVKEEYLQTTCLDAPPPHVGTGACCSQHEKTEQDNLYETKELLNAYLLLHYGNEHDTFSIPTSIQHTLSFPQRTARLLCEMVRRYHVNTERALDLGCAVGGAAFELARVFKQVLGIDLSESFIQCANSLKHEKLIPYTRKEEGDITTSLSASVDPALDKNRVMFQVGDACSLPSDIGEFDVVLMANLLCRLPSPRSCLMRMGGALGLVKVGGLLLNTSPYSWLKSYTSQAAWLGGKTINGNEVYSHTVLKTLLSEHFELLHEEEMPFVVREHARKFEYVISHVTVWRRIK